MERLLLAMFDVPESYKMMHLPGLLRKFSNIVNNFRTNFSRKVPFAQEYLEQSNLKDNCIVYLARCLKYESKQIKCFLILQKAIYYKAIYYCPDFKATFYLAIFAFRCVQYVKF